MSHVVAKGFSSSWALAAALTIMGCSDTKTSHVVSAEITSVHVTDEIPSASGICKSNGGFFIISDDSPFLFRVNSDLVVQEKVRLVDTDEDVHRLAKHMKPDFEAVTPVSVNGSDELWLFGSGSTPSRETLAVVEFSPVHKISKNSLSTIYSHIRNKAGVSPEDFNIEGAATWKENLILMNRGSNQLYMVNLQDLMEWMKGGSAADISIVTLNLPSINNFKASVSGGSVIEGTDLLLFSASVEATTDWYNDGEVLGSYIGVVDLNDPLKIQVEQVYYQGEAFKGKIEGVDAMGHQDKLVHAIGVCDNDDGRSSIIHLQLTLKEK